jgi:hypothetical protein
MTPFDVDFLANDPPWLGKASTTRPRVKVRNTANAMTVPAAMGTVSTAVLGLAMIGAVALGPVNRSSANHDLETADVFVRSVSAQELAWDQYLLRLEDPVGRFPGHQIRAVKTVWERFQQLNPRIKPPHTAPTDDGVLSMVWDAHNHHLEVDVDADRRVAFFYTDRATKKYESKEKSLAEHLPTRLHEIVKLLA